MSLEAINEQLLRAVGVGIAVFAESDLSLQFHNEPFGTWFFGEETGNSLTEIFPTLDQTLLLEGIKDKGQHVTEWQFRKKRRTLVIAQTFTRTKISGENVLVLECQNVTRIRELESMIESYSNMVERNTREIQREKEQVEKLLLNVMPRSAYDEYKNFGVVEPTKYSLVSVLELDFVGFYDAIKNIPPATIVSELNELFSAFDRIGEQFGCERIKTTGDTYLCISGMHDVGQSHADAVANAALRFIRYIRRRNENADRKWQCRAGIGTGSVIGSVVGVQKYVYDVFGEAVQLASQARRSANAMEILVSPATIESFGGDLKVENPRSKTAKEIGFSALAAGV